MKLYVTMTSPYARLARIVVHEKALADRVEIIAAKTRTPGSPYYAINPSGRVPYLVTDDGTGLEDSQVICAYLDGLEASPRFHPASDPDWSHRRLEAVGRSMLDGIAVWAREKSRPETERSPTTLAHEAARAPRIADFFEGQVAHPLMQGPLNMAQLVLAVESAALERLGARWRSLCDRLGLDPDAAAPTLADLVRAYSEQGRHYHSLDHVAALLLLLDRHGSELADRSAVELAIFFHDAVYVPTRSDNEAQSAALARDRLTALGLPGGLVARVADLVLATRHGSEHAEPAHDADMALLLDLDLSVLAADRPAYADYARAIRREYAIYPDEVYRPGRRRVLGQFLARSRIYRTDRLHELWDAAARANLAWEIAELS